jgi:hypothetical protein
MMRPVIAGLLLLKIVIAGCNQPARNEVSTGRYQLAVDGQGNAWQLDTVTGDMKRCWQGAPGIRSPICYKVTQE